MKKSAALGNEQARMKRAYADEAKMERIQRSQPTVVTVGHLCKQCTAWIPLESHGTYCPEKGRTHEEPKDA